MSRSAYPLLWQFCAVFALGTATASGAKSVNAESNNDPNTLAIEKITLPVEGVGSIGSSEVLRAVAAWRLNADHTRFGGFSAILPFGETLLLVSDGGMMFRFNPESDAPVAELSRLPATCAGDGASNLGDSESVAKTRDGRAILIGMERSNMLCSFEWDKPEAATLSAPPAIAPWPRNRGAEAMSTLAGVGTAILGETDLDKDGHRPLLWYAGDPSLPETPLVAMRYLPPKGYKPADAAFLPDGRLLVLNRRYRLEAGRASILTLVPAFTPSEGGSVTGTEVARLAGSHLAVNFEGMTVVPRQGGATVWLVSDDNFDSSKGTVLMRLEWTDSKTVAPPR